MKYTLYRETRENGCGYSDGSDSFKVKTNLLLVAEGKETDYADHCAEEFGYQDYSYKFSTKEIATFDELELVQLKRQILYVFREG